VYFMWKYDLGSVYSINRIFTECEAK